ncbi:MAG: ankyrin repeat domain-containing protein [Phycisphaerales bacterium]|nr:ankyrin repeat domain-containing protein [Phycisphaerales bacterium]
MKYRTGPLVKCVFRNDFETLKTILTQGMSPDELDSDGRTPLIHAAIDNKLSIARYLLDAGANVDHQDGLECTALHYAAQNHHKEIVELLLNRGARLEVGDVNGNTPLSNAVFYSQGRGSMIRMLLDAGADRNHMNKHGVSPLSLAQSVSNYDLAQFFK